MVTHYFAYGSNMSIEHLRRLIGHVRRIGVGALKGYEFVFGQPDPVKKTVYATIVPTRGGVVYGVVYEVTEMQWYDLDRYEAVPEEYHKKVVHVTLMKDGRIIPCVVYIGNQVQKGTPSKHYLDLILRGAKENELPIDYIRQIEAKAHEHGTPQRVHR